MVTGRISLRSPEYSPISSSVSEVRAISSRFHWRPATGLVTRISVVALAFAMGAAPTKVLARPPAWQHHHARSAGPERLGGHLLIVAQMPAVLSQGDRMCLAVDISGQIFSGPADLEHHLFDPAPLAGMDDDGVVVDPRTQHRRDLLVAQHFLEHGAVKTDQRHAVGRALDQLQSPVAGHRVDDVDQQRLRYGIA